MRKLLSSMVSVGCVSSLLTLFFPFYTSDFSKLSSPAPAHQLQTSLSEMDRRFDELVAARAVAASSQ